MLYLEFGIGTEKGQVHVFSNKDNDHELDRFRCQVRAPKHAFRDKTKENRRPFLVLFGSPRERASQLIIPSLVFSTPEKRVEWEKSQSDIMAQHPEAFYPNAGARK